MSSIITGAGLNSFRSQFTAGTTFALAEIIDNSIQWKRSDQDCTVDIIMIESPHGGGWRLNEILIVDNGLGMSYDSISTCLNFGGGSNHGSEVKGRLGKYGLGLPYASSSQCREYHVYSWENRANMYHTFRNHDKYLANDPVVPEEVDRVDSLPQEFYEVIPRLSALESGTIINWKNCDRLDVSFSKTLINNINKNLGRIYRHYITSGVNINFQVYRKSGSRRYDRMTDLCSPIGIYDPMFLTENTILPVPYNNQRTNLPWGGEDGTGEKILVFSEKMENGVKRHEIKLRYSIARDDIQANDGGNREPGKTYYKKATGISLVRANRELKLSDFGFPFPNGNGDQRHRWWSIEVSFEPVSDDILGVQANKLDARNFRYLDSADYAELESNGMYDESVRLRHELSKEIDRAIKGMWEIVSKRGKGSRGKQKCPQCGQPTFVDGKCESCDYKADFCPKHGIKLLDGKCPMCGKVIDLPMCVIHRIPFVDGKCPTCPDNQPPLTDEQREELLKIIRNDYPEVKDDEEAIQKILEWFVRSNQRHFMVFTNLRAPNVFINHIEFQNKFTIIEVNNIHPFYEHFIDKILKEDDDNSMTPLLLFLASWVETERRDYSNSEVLKRFRGSFGNSLMDVIANWKSV